MFSWGYMDDVDKHNWVQLDGVKHLRLDTERIYNYCVSNFYQF